jgi:putative ABC transport system substrate-binding protein
MAASHPRARSRKWPHPTSGWTALSSHTSAPLTASCPRPTVGRMPGDRIVDRRAFLGSMGVGLLAAPFVVEAQRAVTIARVGVLSPADPPSGPSSRFDALRRGLRERGWVERQNIAIEWRFAKGIPDRLPKLAAELARLKVDVILTINTPATQAAKSVTSTVPIVFNAIASTTAAQLVTSLAHPGGNLTGITTISAEMSGKRLELMKEALPRIKRAAVLWNARNEGAEANFRQADAVAARLGLQIQDVRVSGPNDLRGAFEAATKRRAEAILLIDDVLLSSYRASILELAQKHRLPVISIYRDFADAGGFVAYGPSAPDTYYRCAYFIDRILKGAKPADLPVEQPTKFELVINLKTAKALGLTIPPSVLLRADELIQ